MIKDTLDTYLKLEGKLLLVSEVSPWAPDFLSYR